MNDELKQAIRELAAIEKQIQQVTPEEDRKALQSFYAALQKEIIQSHLEEIINLQAMQFSAYTNRFVRKMMKRVGETENRIAQEAADVRIEAPSKSHHPAST